MFMKIRAHRGEFLNEKTDRWADEGREDVDNVRWDGPSSHPTFSWTVAGVKHRCCINKTLRARVHLKVAELQLPLHKNFTSEFLNWKDNSRDLLGKRWQDKAISDWSKRRLLQSINYQFPCAKLLKLWGLQRTMSAGSVNAYTWMWHCGPKASAISKPDVRLSENPELLCIMASSASYLHPSAGTPWRCTTTARGNGAFRQRSVRPLTRNGQSAKFSCI